MIYRLWLFALIATLAWGAGAFGSPYPWAYWPLIFASAGVGATGLWLGRNRSGAPAYLVGGLVVLALAIAVQLVPLSIGRLQSVSPAAVRLLRQHLLHFDMLTAHPISIDPVRTQLGLVLFGAFALLMIGTARALTRYGANQLAAGVLMLGVALAIVAIVQRATFNGKVYGFWELVQGGSPFGPFVNRNHFAGWMLMGLPLAMGYFLALVDRGMRDRKPGARNVMLWFGTPEAGGTILTGFGILTMSLALILSLSRSGIMGFVLALVVTGTVMSRKLALSRRLFVTAFLLFIAIVAVSMAGVDRVGARFSEGNAATAGDRLGIWSDAITIAKDFRTTGTGLNTFGVSTLYYQTSEPGFHLREAHSDYLQLAAEGGLLLGIPIVLTIVLLGLAMWRRLREDVGSIWWIRMGAVTGLIGIACQSIGEFSLQMPGNAAFCAVLAGLALHDGRGV